MGRAHAWLLCALMLIITSCGGLQSRLEGQWISDDQSQQVEFFKDGTAVFKNFGISVTAQYAVLDASHLKFQFSGPVGILVGTQVAKVTVQGDRLVLDFEAGISIAYTRMK